MTTRTDRRRFAFYEEEIMRDMRTGERFYRNNHCKLYRNNRNDMKDYNEIIADYSS